MPILNLDKSNPTVDGRQSERALIVCRGVSRHFLEMGYALISEFTLVSGRRADLIGINTKGHIVIIEIKSSVEDFRVDRKWPEYKTYCDDFYFATLGDVPAEIFPEAEGFIVADSYGCEIIRGSDQQKIPPATRRALTIRIARASALRLGRVLDFCEQNSMGLPDDIRISEQPSVI